MTCLIYQQDRLVGDWVAKQLRLQPYNYELTRCIGIAHDNVLIAGVAYNGYLTDSYNRPMLIEMAIASIDKAWCTRHNLNQLFSYPFIHLGVKRVQATCGRKAKRTRKFLERLGFKLEGIMREANPLGGDCAHYSMLRNECLWIEHGKILTKPARSTRSSHHGQCSNRKQPANGAL